MKVTLIYICEDCTFVFQVYGIKRRKEYFCPCCGENVNVIPYQAERNSSSVKKVKWKPEELQLLQECINGKLQPYQVAIMIGRSINAVVKKTQRMRQRNE